MDVALDPVQLGNAHGDVVRAQVAAAQVAPQARDEARVHVGAELAEIGQRAGFPEPADHPRPLDVAGQWLARQALEHREVDRLGRGGQLALRGRCLQVRDQRREAVEPRFRLAPVEFRQRGEAVFLDRVDFVLGKLGRRALRPGQGAECAVLLVPARPSRDLCHFRRDQPPLANPVELGERGEGDVVDVKVETHADRVGGDNVIDFARLEHRHLAIARLRAQRAHDHGRPAAIPAQHLGHGVDLLGREGDDRAARRQARELARADVAQGGKARARFDRRPGDQRADQRLDRRRAQQHRFLPPAGMEQAIGEDMAALAVGRKLRLVKRDEGGGRCR